MLRQLWRLFKEFVVGVGRELKKGVTENRKGLLISLGIVVLVLAVLMGALLKATARPEFCGSCHNMTSYIDSWRESSHKDVACTDCHFEPGFFGSIEGKWKAQTHIVMKITGTSPARPHTQISDASCLRQGCHATEDLKAKTSVFKGVPFSHDTHLGDLKAGKKLRCVTCHSQIVQGQHLTITESTCFTCHFYGDNRTSAMSDCSTCHKQTKEKIYIDANENMPFVHQEYLDRGVNCGQCHFDIVSGDGHLKDNICVQCHSEPDILLTADNVEEMHTNHITNHKVECYRCHSAIDHGIVRTDEPELRDPQKFNAELAAAFIGQPLDANCAKCHTAEKHKSIRLMYMGTGAAEIADMPSPMYGAHADCGSCHIPVKDGDGPGVHSGGVRMSYAEVIQSCADCHGPGYDDMAKHWKDILTKEIAKAQKSLASGKATVSSARAGKEKDEANAILTTAASNLTFVEIGRGLHNMDYALKILVDVQERAERAKKLVSPAYAVRKITSPSGCTQLCHSCVECIETTPVPFGNVQFPHDVHVADEGMKCQECHSPREQHGQTFLKNCNQCHHGSGMGSVECQDCHQDNFNLYNGQNACDEKSCDVRGEKNSMAGEVACKECHVNVAKDKPHTLESVKETCVECHDDSYGPMTDELVAEAKALNVAEMTELLKSTQAMVLDTIRAGEYTYDAQDLLNKAERNLKLVTMGNPVHNVPFSKDLLSRVNELVLQARKTLQMHSTIKTIEPVTSEKKN